MSGVCNFGEIMLLLRLIFKKILAIGVIPITLIYLIAYLVPSEYFINSNSLNLIKGTYPIVNSAALQILMTAYIIIVSGILTFFSFNLWIVKTLTKTRSKQSKLIIIPFNRLIIFFGGLFALLFLLVTIGSNHIQYIQFKEPIFSVYTFLFCRIAILTGFMVTFFSASNMMIRLLSKKPIKTLSWFYKEESNKGIIFDEDIENKAFIKLMIKIYLVLGIFFLVI